MSHPPTGNTSKGHTPAEIPCGNAGGPAAGIIEDQTAPGASNESTRRALVFALVVIPLLAVTVLASWLSLQSLLFRLNLPYPQTPWESSILADAFRASRGQEVYENIARDPSAHATHLYGPLLSQFIGVVFRITGSRNLQTGRWINLVASIIIGAIFVWGFTSRRRSPIELILAAGLWIELHYRGRAYFAETRPDLTAALLATLAVLCFYRAHRHDGRLALGWYLPGTALVLLAFLFKQTYAACAAVPIAAVIIARPAPLAKHLFLACVPLVVLAGFVLGIQRTFTPVVFFYTIDVPKMYAVTIPRLGLAGMSVLMHGPLLVAQLGWTMCDPKGQGAAILRSRIGAWLLAAAAVGALASIPAFAKRGGSYNSLLLGWIPMTALSIALLGPMLRAIVDTATGWGRRDSNSGSAGSPLSIWPQLGCALVCGGFVAALILTGTLGVPSSDKWNWNYAHGGAEYTQVVNAARALHGIVICPDDPTIPMLARGEVGRSLEAELDATGRKTFTPGLVAEIGRADWMVTVHGSFDDKRFSEAVMADFGFQRVRDDRFGKRYALWKRIRQPSTTSPATQPGESTPDSVTD